MPTSKALVFDIKRFAVHDGNGLRTTVFFKGCPLRCEWCQNPEGLEAKQKTIHLKNQCIHCKLCTKFKGIGWDKDHPVIHTEEETKPAIDTCPSAALRYDSTWYTEEQLLEEIKKDEVFFKRGGGVTFSGGEPLMHLDFLQDIVKACKKEGIHTAIESSFFSKDPGVKDLVQDLDQIYCDFKIADAGEHKTHTGQDNSPILENITWMLNNKDIRDKVTIRTPLVPGITATDENIASIAKTISTLYPGVKYELLNWNPLAPAKYELAGRAWTLDSWKPFSKAEMKHFQDVARENGIQNLVTE